MTAGDALESALRASRARIEAPHGRPRAESFGGVEEEHRRLTESAGLLDESDRAILRMAGRQPRRMLNGLLTADLSPLDEGRGVYGFVLTAKGRPVAELRALPGPPGAEGPWLDTPAVCLAGLREHFGRYLPPIYATAEIDPSLGRLGLVGPRADAALARWLEERGAGGDVRRRVAEGAEPALSVLDPAEADGPSPDGEAGGPSRGGAALRLVRREPAEGPGWDLYGARDALAEAWPELLEAAGAEGGGPAGRRAWRILRVERGVPAYGSDITEENLPQETGQEDRAISYGKGCYTGQEVVARIHYRGHVNRRLCGLRLPEGPDVAAAAPDADAGPGDADGEAGAGAGDAGWEGRELFRDGRAVGRVTTAVRSPRLGAVALGYVRREVEAGERLATESEGGAEVEVVGLPFVVE